MSSPRTRPAESRDAPPAQRPRASRARTLNLDRTRQQHYVAHRLALDTVSQQYGSMAELAKALKDKGGGQIAEQQVVDNAEYKYLSQVTVEYAWDTVQRTMEDLPTEPCSLESARIRS